MFNKNKIKLPLYLLLTFSAATASTTTTTTTTPAKPDYQKQIEATESYWNNQIKILEYENKAYNTKIDAAILNCEGALDAGITKDAAENDKVIENLDTKLTELRKDETKNVLAIKDLDKKINNLKTLIYGVNGTKGVLVDGSINKYCQSIKTNNETIKTKKDEFAKIQSTFSKVLGFFGGINKFDNKSCFGVLKAALLAAGLIVTYSYLKAEKETDFIDDSENNDNNEGNE
jgi:hypothetical protein